MSNVGPLMFRSAFVAALVASSWSLGCVSNEPDDKGTAGSGNTPVAGSTSMAGSTSSAGTAAGGSGAGGSGGSGGSGGAPMAAACATVAKASGTSPVIVNFEEMASATGTYTFESAALLGGTYIYTDTLSEEPSTSKLLFEAGHSAESTQALVGQINNATWGGGMGLWFACMDAGTYTGITFWAKGSSPGGPVTFLLTVNDVEAKSKGGLCADGATCKRPSVVLELTEEWKQFTFAWADFTAGENDGSPVPATGDALYGLEFAFANDNMSNDMTLSLDDVAFTTE